MPHDSLASTTDTRYDHLAESIRTWGRELGFQQVGIADTDLAQDEAYLLNWLEAGRHGEMDYMARHGTRRSRPQDLQPGTLRVISVRMDYVPPGVPDGWDILENAALGYVSRYALGRDAVGELLQAVAHQLVVVAAERVARDVAECGIV